MAYLLLALEEVWLIPWSLISSCCLSAHYCLSGLLALGPSFLFGVKFGEGCFLMFLQTLRFGASSVPWVFIAMPRLMAPCLCLGLQPGVQPLTDDHACISKGFRNSPGPGCITIPPSPVLSVGYRLFHAGLQSELDLNGGSHSYRMFDLDQVIYFPSFIVLN